MNNHDTQDEYAHLPWDQHPDNPANYPPYKDMDDISHLGEKLLALYEQVHGTTKGYGGSPQITYPADQAIQDQTASAPQVVIDIVYEVR